MRKCCRICIGFWWAEGYSKELGLSKKLYPKPHGQMHLGDAGGAWLKVCTPCHPPSPSMAAAEAREISLP